MHRLTIRELVEKHGRKKATICKAIAFFKDAGNKDSLTELEEAIASTRYRIRCQYERLERLKKGSTVTTKTNGNSPQGPKTEKKVKKFVDQGAITATWRLIGENEKLLAELQGLLKNPVTEAVETLAEVLARHAGNADDAGQ